MREQSMWTSFLRVISNRCLIMFLIMAAGFYTLLARLFFLQIVNGSAGSNNQIAIETKDVPIPASRGNVYDRLGRPLAVNKSAYSIKMDASMVKIDAENLYDVVRLLEGKGETIVDTFPFTKQEPYEFAFSGTGRSEGRWKLDMDFKQDEMGLNAEESFQKLRVKFKVPEGLPNNEARKTLNLCNMLYLQRYTSWETITIAYDVRLETLSIIEEETVKYAGFSAEVQPIREYPEGKYFSHIVGYTGKINEEQINSYPGYDETDVIGQNGIESAYEARLHGTDGKAEAEVTAARKIVNFLPNKIAPVSGDNVYLTLDRDLQRAAYGILENKIRDTIINELRGVNGIKNPITLRKFFVGLVSGVSIDIEKVMAAEDGGPAAELKNYALAQLGAPNPQNHEDRALIRAAFAEAVEGGLVSPASVLLTMLGQGVISDETGGLAENLQNGRASTMGIVIDKLESGEITPQMVNLDPCSGSIVVSDVNTGNVLAAVNYPSYDTNLLVNKLDYGYFVSLLEDPTSPMMRRAFMERRAPGSTLKMVSAITALESGSITPKTKIVDGTTFTAAGRPYLKCWSSVGHGAIDVSEALGVSCNYFFCESIFRIGNDKAGNKLDSISALDKYLALFGLNGKSGVEIGESEPIMPNPGYKKELLLALDPGAREYDLEWHDGDSVQTSIGQSFNNYTAANMNKYFLTLATRGRRYQLHLVDSVRGADGLLTEKTRPHVEAELSDISDSTWEAVYRGMLLVTSSGTGANTFRGFPITVAGKTGTAQEVRDGSRNDHSSFGGFAPYEDPQIAVYVSVPFGDTKAMPSIASQIALQVIDAYFGLGSGPEYPETTNGLIQ